MHFLIFLPSVSTPDPRHLEAVGLADFTAGASFMAVSGADSPTGEPGSIVGWQKPGAMEMQFAPDRQTWVRAATSGDLQAGRYHVGFWTDRSVTPADIGRPYKERGPSLTLGDGNSWQVPRFRELTRDMILADDGTWQFDIQRQYAALVDESIQWWERFAAADETTPFSFGDAANFVLRCLRINYRITAEVASYLRLFTSPNVLTTALEIVSLSDVGGSSQNV